MSNSGLEDHPFSFTASKQGKVFVHWRGRQAIVLKASKAEAFLTQIKTMTPSQQQLLMARVTGNFKRGNEKK